MSGWLTWLSLSFHSQNVRLTLQHTQNLFYYSHTTLDIKWHQPTLLNFQKMFANGLGDHALRPINLRNTSLGWFCERLILRTTSSEQIQRLVILQTGFPKFPSFRECSCFSADFFVKVFKLFFFIWPRSGRFFFGEKLPKTWKILLNRDLFMKNFAIFSKIL